jgi:PAS domain S-box-containing protein
MRDEDKTKEELLEELRSVRHQLAEFKARETERPRREEEAERVASFLRLNPNPVRESKCILYPGEDITQRRQAEALLKESEQKFKAIFNNATDGILLADVETKKFYLGNPKIGAMLGYDLEELYNLSVLEIHPPEHLPFVLEQFRKLAQQAISIASTIPLLRKDGHIIYADINTTHITLGEKTYLTGFFRDVTARRQAKKKLRHSQSLLQAVFDGISDPLFLVDDNMTVKILNRPAALYYPTTRQNALGKPCYTAFLGRSEPCEGCEIQMAITKGHKTTLERPGLINPKLTEKVYIYPLHETDGRATGAIIRIMNITEEKILQQRLMQHEKLSALGLLVAGMAHEINNPNNFISFSISILRDFCQEMLLILDRHFESNPAAGSATLAYLPYGEFRRNLLTLIDNIEYGSKRITATVSNLAGFVRSDDYQLLQPTELKLVIDRAVFICTGQIQKMVKSLEVNLAENIPEMVTSPQAVEQVLINLLINAAQAVDKENSWIKINAFFKNDLQGRVIIEVQDNGVGLNEEIKEKIFDPFFTTKPAGEGTGLGLFISQSLIKSLGGSIEMDSEPGQGSTFRIILPKLNDKT